jgi:hypothetical protein
MEPEGCIAGLAGAEPFTLFSYRAAEARGSSP